VADIIALLALASTHRTITEPIAQRLVALPIFPMMHRRELMCGFHGIHKWLADLTVANIGPSSHTPHAIPTHVRDELIALALLLVFARANLRRPVSTRITATDATVLRGATVAAIVTQPLADMLFDLSESRAEYCRLDWSARRLMISPSKLQDHSAFL